ncbi:hypothetical protein [Lysobacter xanthus]
MVGATQERKRRHAARKRLWGLAALHFAGIDISMANRQLVKPPDGNPFKAGVSPPPLTDPNDIAETFEGPIVRGANPAGDYCSAIADRYRLAERVEEHLPGSRQWLLEDIAFYFDDGAPDINASADSLEKVLGRLGLRRLSWNTATFGEKVFRDSYWQLAKRQLDYFATLPSIDYLQLLVCFAHEQVWLHPYAARRHERYLGMVLDALHTAVDTLCTHPLLGAADTGVDMEVELRSAFVQVRRNIEYFGLRSHARPSRHADPLLSPTLFVRDFKGFDDADFCAGLDFAVPIEQRENPRSTPFSVGTVPTFDEAAAAFDMLLARLDLPKDTRLVDFYVERSPCAVVWNRFQRCL